MGSRGPIYTLSAAAQLMSENAEPVEEVTANSDNVDYGEIIHIHDGFEHGLTGFTERGVECAEELLADIRTWPGSIRWIYSFHVTLPPSPLFDPEELKYSGPTSDSRGRVSCQGYAR